jgi:circadian clock protein KaiC
LDSLIEGGIPRGFTVLLAGNPGTGKTILASQFLFDGLNKGENGLYVSFSESKDQYYVNMEKLGMDFKDFERKRKFVFLDFASMIQDGMRDALEEVLATVVGTKIKRLVVDSISAISHSYQNQVISARIILQTILGKIMRLEGVTCLLIAEVPIGRDVIGLGIEESITDGNIWLKHGSSDASPLLLNVFKMRRTAIIKEPHVCIIIPGRGMTLYPKQSLRLTYPATNERLASGISGIDSMTGGGFLKGSVTGIIGAAGTGKTTFCFQFIAEGIKSGEAGIFYSLEESADEIRRMAENYGYDIEALEKKGLKILARNPEYYSADAFVAEVADEIERSPVKRLVVDALNSFGHTTFNEEDVMYIVGKRLASFAREKGITAIFSILSTQQSDVVLKDLGGLSTFFQNIMLLRYAEINGRMKRAMIILKMRSTPHDDSILQFDMSPIELANDGWWKEGPLKITGSLEEYGGILTGNATRLPQNLQKKEMEILRTEAADKAQRADNFQQKEEETSVRLQNERARRIAGYEGKKANGEGEKRSGGKGQRKGKRKPRKKTRPRGR